MVWVRERVRIHCLRGLKVSSASLSGSSACTHYSQKKKTYHYNIPHPLHSVCQNPTTAHPETGTEFALPGQLPTPRAKESHQDMTFFILGLTPLVCVLVTNHC